MKALTWERVAVKAVAIGIPIIVSIVGFIAMELLSWGVWVTRSLEQIESDIRVIKVANHLSLSAPEFGVKPKWSPTLANPFWLEELIAAPKGHK